MAAKGGVGANASDDSAKAAKPLPAGKAYIRKAHNIYYGKLFIDPNVATLVG